MLSNSLAYAIKALIYISHNSSETERITLKEVSDSTEVPKPYIAKILQDLVRNNVLHSIKGPNGGFYFSEEGL
ncbi:MAG: RrF2 family transcriptional regulator, partial [Croceimicrobium sp.]